MARELLRAVLAAETGTPPESWRFAAGASGRPRVVEPSFDRMKFSLSYGDDTVAIAISERLDVGVDIEPLVPVGSSEIPWSELSPRERARLERLRTRERYACFVRMWTLKEAFAKCSGQGAALAFSTVETTLEPPSIGIPGGVVPLHSQDVEVDGRRHALAVCTQAGPPGSADAAPRAERLRLPVAAIERGVSSARGRR